MERVEEQRGSPAAVSLLAYTIITIIIGRDVLAHLGSMIANDAGDPLLTAAILKWNATHVPLTDAWYQFPIFYPTRDTLTFSEHLLGLSVIASPIYWLTGDVVVTYNLVLLLTFPLCGIAMYALVYRLTGSAAGRVHGRARVRVRAVSHLAAAAHSDARDRSGRRWRCSGCTRTSRRAVAAGSCCTARRGCCRARPTAMRW